MKAFAAYISAVIDTVILTSIVSTQLVLADVAGFGVAVSLNDRIGATLHDLIGLGPALALLIAASFAVAFPLAAFLQRRFGASPMLWYMAAGLLAMPAALMLLKVIMGGTLLASARTPLGMLLVALCGLVGGWVFAWVLNLLSGRTTAKEASV